MVPEPQIQTSSKIEVSPIRLVISFIKRVLMAVINWSYKNLILPRLIVNHRIFANEMEFDLPPPKG